VALPPDKRIVIEAVDDHPPSADFPRDVIELLEVDHLNWRSEFSRTAPGGRQTFALSIRIKRELNSVPAAV